MSIYRDLVPVADKGANFATTIDWAETPLFAGTYNGSISKQIRGEARTFHTFTDDDGAEYEAWGTAILDSRLKDIVPGTFVQITYLGKNAQTKRGVLAHNFDVLYDPKSVPGA